MGVVLGPHLSFSARCMFLKHSVDNRKGVVRIKKNVPSSFSGKLRATLVEEMSSIVKRPSLMRKMKGIDPSQSFYFIMPSRRPAINFQSTSTKLEPVSHLGKLFQILTDPVSKSLHLPSISRIGLPNSGRMNRTW